MLTQINAVCKQIFFVYCYHLLCIGNPHTVTVQGFSSPITLFPKKHLHFITTAKIKRQRAYVNTGFWRFNRLLELGKLTRQLNLFCLSFMCVLPLFYFNYTIYFGLLIFCCQSVAIGLLYQSATIKQDYESCFDIQFKLL